MLTNETDPLTLPTEVGAKATLNVTLAPAAIVSGTVRPLMLNPIPETFVPEIVSPEVPVFLRLIVWVLLVPVTTFPKLTTDGVAESRG